MMEQEWYKVNNEWFINFCFDLRLIKTLEHIKGAKEAEETFLKILGE